MVFQGNIGGNGQPNEAGLFVGGHIVGGRR